jgi:hypothetical protein
MHRVIRTALALSVLLLLARVELASAQDQSRAVTGGGISVPGWVGKVDPNEATAGQTVNNAKLVKEGDALHATTGPAIVYWHPDNKATGNYTVKATFREPKFMSLNDHPHPYGLFIAGNDMGSDQQSLLYCTAYGNGTFIVRGFGPAPFRVNGNRPEANAAVRKVATGEAVAQEIALAVKGDKIECSVNGTVVGSYDKAAVLGEGKLKSTDGMWGIRLGHNTEAVVTGLGITKN